MVIQMDQSVSLVLCRAGHLVHYVCPFSHSSLSLKTNNIFEAKKNEVG